MSLDGFADFFVARDGDATGAGVALMAALVVALIVLAAAVVLLWVRSRMREDDNRDDHQRHLALVNSQRIAELAEDEQRLAEVIGEIRHHLTGGAPESRPRLKLVKGG